MGALFLIKAHIVSFLRFQKVQGITNQQLKIQCLQGSGKQLKNSRSVGRNTGHEGLQQTRKQSSFPASSVYCAQRFCTFTPGTAETCLIPVAIFWQIVVMPYLTKYINYHDFWQIQIKTLEERSPLKICTRHSMD